MAYLDADFALVPGFDPSVVDAGRAAAEAWRAVAAAAACGAVAAASGAAGCGAATAAGDGRQPVPGAAASDRGWHRAAPALAGLAIAAAGCARSAAALERREPTFTRVTPVAASEVEAALLADAPVPVETVRLVALLTRTVDHLDAALASVCGSIGAAGSETPGFLDGVRAARDHRAAAHEQAYRAALLLSAAATAANGLADEVEGWTIDGRSDGRGWVDQLGTYVPGMLIAAGLWDRIDDVRGLDAGDGTFCHLGPRLRAAAGTSTTFSVELEAWPQTDPPVRSRYTRESLPAG